MCLRTGTMDFFVTVRSGALRFISCDVRTTISSNTLTCKEGNKAGAAEWRSLRGRQVRTLFFGKVSLSPTCHTQLSSP